MTIFHLSLAVNVLRQIIPFDVFIIRLEYVKILANDSDVHNSREFDYFEMVLIVLGIYSSPSLAVIHDSNKLRRSEHVRKFSEKLF